MTAPARLPGHLQCQYDAETTIQPIWSAKGLLTGCVTKPAQFSPCRDFRAVSSDPLCEHLASHPLLQQAEVTRTHAQCRSGFSFCLPQPADMSSSHLSSWKALSVVSSNKPTSSGVSRKVPHQKVVLSRWLTNHTGNSLFVVLFYTLLSRALPAARGEILWSKISCWNILWRDVKKKKDF